MRATLSTAPATPSEQLTREARCGRCHHLMALPTGRRPVRCPHCAWMNALPREIEARCGRCANVQVLRLRQVDQHPPCSECGITLLVPTIVLTPMAPQLRRVRYAQRRKRHQRAVASIMFVALVVALVLTWLILV